MTWIRKIRNWTTTHPLRPSSELCAPEGHFPVKNGGRKRKTLVAGHWTRRCPHVARKAGPFLHLRLHLLERKHQENSGFLRSYTCQAKFFRTNSFSASG